MPSKLLIAAPEAAYEVCYTTPFGIHIEGEIRINGREVMARVWSERDRFVGRVLGRAASIPAQDRYTGYACFIDDTVLAIGDYATVQAHSVVIATGSGPYIPPALLVFGDRLVVNDDVFNWEDLPHRIAVFGPGVIGLEVGQAFTRLGVQVRVFDVQEAVGLLTDPMVVEQVKFDLGEEFYLHPDATIHEMKLDDNEAVIVFTELDGSVVTGRFNYVLACTGRKSNVDSLNLENTTLQLNKLGILVFDAKTLQCGTAPVFIAGDANNILLLLHEAADEGKMAGRNAAHYPDIEVLPRRAPISIVSADPQIAMVGQRYVDQEPRNIVTEAMDFTDQGRS